MGDQTSGNDWTPAFAGVTIRLANSPSTSLMIWIGSFVAGIAAATIFVSEASFDRALPAIVGCSLFAVLAGFILKNKTVRLFIVAGLLFLIGASRYLSANDDTVDLLSLLPALAHFKEWFTGVIERMLPEPHAGFLTGLLVGGGVRSPDLRAAFIATGTIHVMALSGWNLNLIERWLGRGLSFLRFKKAERTVVAALIIVAYVIMTGASPSLVRAAVMAIIVYVAEASGRRSAGGRAVLYAAALILLVSPRALGTDIGFLLSVAATLGIVYLSPIFEPLTKRLPDILKLPETVAGTLGATLATLPVVLAAFGQTSLVALAANILLLPFIAPTMAAGFVGIIVSSVIPLFSAFCGWAIQIFTAYDIAVVKLFARVPGAAVTGIVFNWSAAVLMAAGMTAAVIYDAHRQKKV